MKKLLGLAIPTNEPSTAFTHLVPSLINIVDAKDYIELLVNFQRPWTDNQIKEVVNICNELGLTIKWKLSKYDTSNGVPFNMIRNDSIMIDDSLPFYFLADDDMIFRGPSKTVNKTYGEQILDAIHYMLIHENCGEVLFSGQLFKKIKTNCIGPTSLVSPYLTGRGLMFRSIKSDTNSSPLFFDETVSLIGAGEEQVASVYRLAKGLYPARLRCARCSHYEYHDYKGTKKSSLAVVPGSLEYNWSKDYYEDGHIGKYIRDNYNENYTNERFNIITEDKYRGIDLNDPEVIVSHTFDYNDIDLETIKSLIDKEVKF